MSTIESRISVLRSDGTNKKYRFSASSSAKKIDDGETEAFLEDAPADYSKDAGGGTFEFVEDDFTGNGVNDKFELVFHGEIATELHADFVALDAENGFRRKYAVIDGMLGLAPWKSDPSVKEWNTLY